MPFPIRTCAVCGEEFELKPDKPGFANRCPSCSEPEETDNKGSSLSSGDSELNAARRNAMRDMLYKKESWDRPLLGAASERSQEKCNRCDSPPVLPIARG